MRDYRKVVHCETVYCGQVEEEEGVYRVVPSVLVRLTNWMQEQKEKELNLEYEVGVSDVAQCDIDEDEQPVEKI